MNIKQLYKKASVILIICMILTSLPVFGAKEQANLLPGNNARAPEPIPPYGYDTIVTKGKDESYLHVTWSSDINGTTEYLQWIRADKLKNGEFPDDPYTAIANKGSGCCRARMTDLEPDTEYAYRVGNALTGWSEIYFTQTADNDDGSFSFLAVGDAQVNSNVDGENWNTSMEKAAQWFGDEIEFMISLGDQTNSGDVEAEYDYFSYPQRLRSLPLITVLGNHDDRSSNYSNHFTYTDVDPDTLSEGGGEYGGNYWVAHDSALIITLNVQFDNIPVHTAYTQRAIDEYTALYGEPVWKIVVFHDSIFSGAASRYNETWDRRDSYSTAFSEMGIDMVLMGHDHIYTRTYMVNGTDIQDDSELYTKVGSDPYGSMLDPAEGDVVYFTANSSSGSKFYEMTDRPLPYAACANQENVPNITKVDVTPDHIAVSTYRSGAANGHGDLVDFFAIHRTAEADEYAPTLNVPRTTYFNASDIPDLTEGISAYDNVDGDLTASIEYSGSVDPFSVSTVTYTVTDKAGNTETVKRQFIPLDPEPVISSEKTEWTYLDDGSWPFDFEEGYDEYRWTTKEFVPQGWKTAKGPFGSIDGEPGEHSAGVPNTLINLYFPEGSDDEGSVIPNFFFRASFDLPDPESVEALIFDTRFDDAVTIYINGVMLRQYNCFLAGSNTGYSGSDRETTSERLPFMVDDKAVLESLNLKESGNIIAVELYQCNESSDDIYFDMTNVWVQRESKPLPFTDVKSNHWFANSVSYCVSKGYISGMTETTFVPSGKLTRAQFLTILAKLDGVDLTLYDRASNDFDDVKTGHWYNEVVCWAVEKEYTSGLSKTKFGPNNYITRAQLAKFFYVYSESNGISVTELKDISAYPDAEKVPAWAKTAMEWAVAAELISGVAKDGTNYLQPNGNATRAQATVMFKAFDEYRN